MIDKDMLYNELLRQAKFALRSKSRCLVYEAYGAAKMAYQLGVIQKDRFGKLNELLVVHGLNDPQYCRENYGGALE